MKSAQIREAFLKYFEKNGHTRVGSSSLIPANDPTLFFTNAGMVQFKDAFTGAERRPYKRATSSQKCMRVSGKHNDLENVGHTPRHHTFFEMLGNFSFGDYFKKEAIAFGWEFLTKEVNLDPSKMSVTVFKDDGEAEKLWKKHIPADRIFRLGEKDNFWAMGDTGPCGPCSEIIWDFGSGPVKKEDLDSDRFMEIWNLVFMQFDRSADGKVVKLAKPSIDTGMGLERLSAVIEGVSSNWETDLFVPIIGRAAEVLKADPKSPNVAVALRVIADHVRCSTFLISDGVIPSNEGRGYVLRRILRRAIRFGKMLGRDEPFMAELVGTVVDEMGPAYPDLATHEHFIEKVIASEDERFFATLGKGLELLKAEMGRAKGKIISGKAAFELYDTYGFPLDVTELIAAENGFSVDAKGFEKNMQSQRERARASWKGSGEESVAPFYKETAAKTGATVFTGYSGLTTEAKVLAILSKGAFTPTAQEGDEIVLVTDQTSFYGESGGQVGDTGVAVAPGLEIEITDTKKPLPQMTVHIGRVKRGELKTGARITLAADSERREAVRRNHTATHLLHRALREVLGEHVKQAGSLVEPDRFRFDFSHFQAMTPDELKDVESKVNDAIRKNYPVITRELTYDEAVAEGALAFFGEKYGERVRMIDISDFSRELCGGTHVDATGEIGMMKIISESSVAAGVRRVEGVTGAGTEKFVEGLQSERDEIAEALKSGGADIVPRIKKLIEEAERLKKELKAAKSKSMASSDDDVMGNAKKIGDINVLSMLVAAPDRETLALWAEKYRDKLGNAVVVLACELEGKVTFVAVVSKGLTPKIHAGKIISALSEVVGGKGGGRPDFAQGGGSQVEKLDEALKKVEEIVRNT